MTEAKSFTTLSGKRLPLPLFFPDATKAVIRTLDTVDITNTKTPGILVNTYHLFKNPGKKVIKEHKGIGKFMNWKGAVISDSGGFQVMTMAKETGMRGKITDKGVVFQAPNEPKFSLTPEDSIDFQLNLKTDLMVVLDDFTPPDASYKEAEETVERTVLWAQRSKKEFSRQLALQKPNQKKPYLIGVAQGGFYQDLRKLCTKELVKIGFDGVGYGGWPINKNGNFDYESAKTIAENVPESYLLYGLGIGKPQEIVNLVNLGYQIFDCVLPTRDARHKRLYIYNANTIEKIDTTKDKFYSYYTPDKEKYYHDTSPISLACDCLLCQNYTRSYLAHLFRSNETSAQRLATIHNLRFYSLLMEKLH